jgi:hypothetical protein
MAGSTSGISPSFLGLSRLSGQVTHVLLTRSRLCPGPKPGSSLHLHVLSTPPAFVLSQDQTLREELLHIEPVMTNAERRVHRWRSGQTGYYELLYLSYEPGRTLRSARGPTSVRMHVEFSKTAVPLGEGDAFRGHAQSAIRRSEGGPSSIARRLRGARPRNDRLAHCLRAVYRPPGRMLEPVPTACRRPPGSPTKPPRRLRGGDCSGPAVPAGGGPRRAAAQAAARRSRT